MYEDVLRMIDEKFNNSSGLGITMKEFFDFKEIDDFINFLS